LTRRGAVRFWRRTLLQGVGKQWRQDYRQLRLRMYSVGISSTATRSVRVGWHHFFFFLVFIYGKSPVWVTSTHLQLGESCFGTAVTSHDSRTTVACSVFVTSVRYYHYCK